MPDAETKSLLDTLTPEQTAALYDEMLAASARGEGVEAVCDFGELVFGVVADAHHRMWIEKKLSHKRVVIVAPPESAKTTWAIILMAWSIGQRPHTRNLIVNASENMAAFMAKAVAECIENNPNWKRVFPNVIPDKAKGWSSNGYEVRDTARSDAEWSRLKATHKDPTLTSGGVGSSDVNSRRVDGRLECDDIHDRKSKQSSTICQETVAFVKDTVLSRVTEDGYFGMVQTRWNPDDSVGYMKGLHTDDGVPMYHVFETPAVLPSGESYWPRQWPLERLRRKEIEVGPQDWQLVWMANAEAARNVILNLESLRTFPVVQIKGEYDRYIGVDFAQYLRELLGSENKDPDNFALAVWVNTHQFLVLEDGYAGRPTIDEAEELFFQWADRLKPVRSAIEINSEGVNFFANLLKRLNTRGGPRHVIIPVQATRNKLARLKEMAPYFRSGQCRVSDDEGPFLKQFKHEWASLGLKGVHDDTLDAAYLGWKTMTALLPSETADQQRERQARQARTQTPAAAIDAVYGLR